MHGDYTAAVENVDATSPCTCARPVSPRRRLRRARPSRPMWYRSNCSCPSAR